MEDGDGVWVKVRSSEEGGRASIENIVNADLNAFNDFFMGLGNDELSRYEVSAIKTYLHWKIFGK